MEILICSYCDGWSVDIDGRKFYWDQEDDHEILREIFEEICPEAEISYEEVC